MNATNKAIIEYLQSSLDAIPMVFTDPALIELKVAQVMCKIDAVKTPYKPAVLINGTLKTQYLYNADKARLWTLIWSGCKLIDMHYQSYPDMETKSWKTYQSHEIVKMADVYSAVMEGMI